MKKLVCIVLMVIFCNHLVAGNGDNNRDTERARLITGKVVDKVSGEEIAGAEIKIADKVIFSDLNGNFSATVATQETEASVSSISYSDKKINIGSFSYSVLIVELESR